MRPMLSVAAQRLASSSSTYCSFALWTYFSSSAVLQSTATRYVMQAIYALLDLLNSRLEGLFIPGHQL